MRTNIIKLASILGAMAFGAQANAAVLDFTLGGSGVSGQVEITYEPNPNTGVLPGTSPNPVDPIGSYIVTGITGSFSDSNIGLSSTIANIVLSDPQNPDPTNYLAPHSFGFYPGPRGTPPGFSYDDLFYPGGSPQTASDYPFHGGYFDIYGVVFTLANGDVVNLWSNGDQGSGVSYGVGVADGADVKDYVGGVYLAVPEPASWAVTILGLGMAGAALRRRARTRLA